MNQPIVDTEGNSLDQTAITNSYEADDKDNFYKQIMEPYTKEENQMKQSLSRIKESMKKVLGYTNKANFNHKTWDVIKQHICLRVIANREKLRGHPNKRNSLFFMKG